MYLSHTNTAHDARISYVHHTHSILILHKEHTGQYTYHTWRELQVVHGKMEINDSMELHECFGDYLSIFHNTECTMHTHYAPYTPPIYWTMPFTQSNREVGCYSEHLCLKQLILSKGTQPALFLLVCPPSFHMCLFSALKLFVSAQYLWLSFYLELKGFLCSETSYHILVWLRMWAEVSQRPACPLSSCVASGHSSAAW